MAFVIGSIFNKIIDALDNRDTRLDHLPFTSPLSAIVVATSYMYFVKVGGPSFMSRRKPFELNNVIIIYNLIQIVLNAALFLYAMYAWWNYKPHFNFACDPIDRGTGVFAIKEARAVYYYYCLKLLDLCDTVFFVLKKKTGQVSFLHVYHHFIVLVFTYKAVGWSPGGHFMILGVINSFVHVIMYTYYLFSVFKPQLQRNVAIKRSVTTIQMIQFLLLMFCFGRPLLNPDCPLPKMFLFEVVAQNVFLFCLFANFYYRNYCVNQRVLNKAK
ncbi:elongation of very long chain fatty acids protein AAEL008004-like isoform X3 [Bradysia coprophila]|uniref:elongation of very long chain fatty acids protein AAEL008004-like isoform X3 n=1 Tax=Bradysia coprophila TaxID=38358 RepID=UPI00187DD8F3|nr:elongation of very long chain fatty acids protein AAEL008004-like isoform X3 [Bradysia coprophila]